MDTLTEDASEQELIETTCEGCSRPYATRVFRINVSPVWSRFCLDCTARRDLGEVVARKEERASDWKKVCPPSYRDCDPEKLPTDKARAALAAALAWQPAEGGLGLIGRVSGQGKSRILHAAAKVHFMAGRSALSVNGADFGLECASRYDHELRAWLTPMRSVSILVLDDLGKEKPSERVATAFYTLIEHRTKRGKPILFTSNFAGDELAARFGEHGPYIVRRLREFCAISIL